MASSLIFREAFFEGEGDDRTIVMMHGFGGSADIMASLGSLTKIPGRWLFPQPRIAVPAGGAPTSAEASADSASRTSARSTPAGDTLASGWAWYPRTEAEMARAVSEPDYVPSLAISSITGLDDARKDLDDFLAEQEVDIENMWIGGFSQGAIMAADFILRRILTGDTLPYGAMLLSGLLLNRHIWPGVYENIGIAPSTRVPHIFVSHGKADEILPYERGLELRDAFEYLGIPVHFHSYDTGHKLYTRELRAMKAYIEGVGDDL